MKISEQLHENLINNFGEIDSSLGDPNAAYKKIKEVVSSSPKSDQFMEAVNTAAKNGTLPKLAYNSVLGKWGMKVSDKDESGNLLDHNNAHIITMGNLMSEDMPYDTDSRPFIEGANRRGLAVFPEWHDEIDPVPGADPVATTEPGMEPGVEPDIEAPADVQIDDPIEELICWAREQGAPADLVDRAAAAARGEPQVPTPEPEPIEPDIASPDIQDSDIPPDDITQY